MHTQKPRRSLSIARHVLTLALTATLGAGCDVAPEDEEAAGDRPPADATVDDPAEGDEQALTSGLPAFLWQRWIWPASNYAMATYRFDGVVVGGVRGAMMRHWQKVGTLGWQSNQNFTYFTVTGSGNRFELKAATGYRQQFQIVSANAYSMVVDGPGGRSVWYSCAASGWPNLIYLSVCGIP